MAKRTVYIPDDLLERAQATDPAAGASALVQRGLQRLVGVTDVPYGEAPADAGELLAQARDRLAAGALAEYQKGYRAALNTIDDSMWSVLDGLSRVDFDVARWAGLWRSGLTSQAAAGKFSPPHWWQGLAGDLGDLLDPIGFDSTNFHQTKAFVRGYGTALRDAWLAVEHSADQEVTDGFEGEADDDPVLEVLVDETEEQS